MEGEDKMERYKESVEEICKIKQNMSIPIPTLEHFDIIFSYMLNSCKKDLRIYCKNLGKLLPNLKITKKINLKVIEEQIKRTFPQSKDKIPGYFIVFDDDMFIFQRDYIGGFRGNANFNNKPIASGMIRCFDKIYSDKTLKQKECKK